MLLKKPAAWYIFALIAAFGVLLACKKEKSVDNGLNTPDQPVMVSASLQGRVLNENQEPVQGAFVYTGAHTTTTDINGSFLIENLITDANATTVHIEKEGYFNGSRTITASDKKLHFVQVELLPKKTGASFTNATGGTVQLQNCKLQFAANQVLRNNNAVYNGTVNIAYAYLNPESSNFHSIMPGDLRGITTTGKETGLESFGMIAVELLGAGGEKLHLDSTKATTLTLTIPASQLSSAPASIPLWYFQEETGLWKEEGSAVKQGGAYVGTVKHFSFWNCDASFPLVDFKARFQDQQGTALGNLQIEIKAKSGTAQASAFVAADGSISGKIPANTALELKVIQYPCKTELYKTNLGPYSQEADLGIIKVTVSTQNQVVLKGSITNCSGANVTEGFVNVDIDGVKYRTGITAGKYSITIPRCNGNAVTAGIGAYDAVTGKSATGSLSVTSGSNTFDINACDDAGKPFINLTVNSQAVQYTIPADSISSQSVQGGTYLEVWALRRTAPFEQFRVTFQNKGTTGQVPYAGITYTTPANKTYSGSATLNITKVDNVIIEGNLTGNFRDSVPGSGTVIQVPVSLTFRAFNR
jgi:hypothetical protein